MTIQPRQSSASDALWRGLPVALGVLLAVGHVFGVAVIDDEVVYRASSWLPAVFVLAQAGLLIGRRRFPLVVLLAVTALDAITLLVSPGAGAGTFAVMVAAYSYARTTTTIARYLVPAGLAVAMTIFTVFALQGSTEVPPEWILPFAVARSALTLGVAILIAEIVDGRARLLDALRERADAAEREKHQRAEEAVLRERAMMARELHDIAAHHLTGIIVSAQAADALRVADPGVAGEYIRQVQRDARATLSNLRLTVGLLRADADGELTPVASIDRLPDLVVEAASAGTEIQFDESGTPRDLGPLAGIAAYRMVQESLANALRHAPGAARTVHVVYGDSSVRLTVTNTLARATPNREEHREGYGLLGMAERAELVGATLRTGRTRDGGWANILEIPYDGETA